MNEPPKERKKIAMFSIHSDPLASLGSQESGGQNIYVRNLAEELEKNNWEVDVFTRWDSPHKKQIAPISKHCRVIRLKGGPVRYVPKTDLLALLPELYNNFQIFCDFKNPYNLFHGHYWDGGWMALQASQKFNRLFVQNFHSIGIVRMETEKRYKKNENEKKYFSKRLKIENDIIKGTSVIISLSEAEKQNLQRFYGCPAEKIRVIPGGVDLKHWPIIEKQKAREMLGIKNDEFVVLFVGRLEWRKGIGTLIGAAKILKESTPNLKVLIIGGKIFGRIKNTVDFKEYKRLQEKTIEEKISDSIVFVGNIDHRRLPVYYCASDVFVVPSYYEPFGLVTLEAMVCKKSVVASNVDGLATIIKDGTNGLLFEPRNALDLKEKIVSIKNSKELSQRLTENAYCDVKENYSWKKNVKKISDLYNNLLTETK